MKFPWHLYLMAATYIGAGIMHFAKPKMYQRILPSYLPGHKLLVLFSGMFEIVLGFAICFTATKNMALYLIIIMLVFFLPVHIHMLYNKKAGMGIPKWVLIWRIPLQFALMLWAFSYLKY
ncbi:hypothetical protein GH721_07485 [Kriegella sp. EG-1]|nr:hypothetical protein [Flavobacteriaceae bacterium EG-1]